MLYLEGELALVWHLAQVGGFPWNGCHLPKWTTHHNSQPFPRNHAGESYSLNSLCHLPREAHPPGSVKGAPGGHNSSSWASIGEDSERLSQGCTFVMDQVRHCCNWSHLNFSGFLCPDPCRTILKNAPWYSSAAQISLLEYIVLELSLRDLVWCLQLLPKLWALRRYRLCLLLSVSLDT